MHMETSDELQFNSTDRLEEIQPPATHRSHVEQPQTIFSRDKNGDDLRAQYTLHCDLA